MINNDKEDDIFRLMGGIKLN